MSGKILPGKNVLIGLPLLLATLALSPSALAAERSLSISGYILNIPAAERIKSGIADLLGSESTLYLDITRLRLKPEAHLSPSTHLTIAYELTSFIKSGSPIFMPVTDKSNRQLFDLTWNPLDSNNGFLMHTIDRLYIKHEAGSFELTIGRQRVSWGTGRIWNPTDLFNPINPASFDMMEKQGADVAKLNIFFGNFSDISMVVQPQRRFSDTNAAFRLRNNKFGYDFSLLGGVFDRRIVIGSDFAGSILGAGVRGETLVSINKDDSRDTFTNWILGADYQLTRAIYFLIEYHFNGEGTKNRDEYDLERLARGEILNVNRSYLFLQSSIEPHPLVKIQSMLNSNLVDGSGFYGAIISVSASENLDIDAGAQVSYGDFMDEYSYYPSVYYIRGMYYF